MKILTIASGKGGVGKTTLSANLGVALASMGRRVVLFDTDLGLANLDIVLGIKPEMTIQHVIDGAAQMTEALVPGPAGTRVLAGGSGIGSMLRLSRRRLEAFLSQVEELENDTDFLIMDAASGADARVMTILKVADEAILVTTPDPSSIVDCYSTVKVLLRYRKDAVISIVVNRVRDGKQARNAFDTINSAALKFLGQQVRHMGFVREDPDAAEIALTRRPFVLVNPRLPASLDVKALADALARNRSVEQDRVGYAGSAHGDGKAA